MDLGLMVNIFDGTDPSVAFSEARASGFSHGQVNVYLPKVTPGEVRQIALAASGESFHVDAVGCYINPLRHNESGLSGVDISDWRCVAENMGMMNGVERIVCWSGTLGKTLATPNLLNHQEDTFNRLYMGLHVMQELVRGLPVEILLEPYSAHVLHDAASCCRMVEKFTNGQVKIVLDAPNIISHKDFSHRNAVLQAHVAALAPVVGLVHLKDMARDENDHRKFPPAGAGTLNYSAYISAICERVPEVPFILDNVNTCEEAIAARDFVNTVAALTL